jgi:hypothetical protein
VFCVALQSYFDHDYILPQEHQTSPMMRYAQGVMSGKYKEDDLFGSLMQAVVLRRDKEERGIGMQGFKYAPNLVEWAHIVFTHSPRAYKSVQEYLPLPKARTLEYVIFWSV